MRTTLMIPNDFVEVLENNLGSLLLIDDHTAMVH
jgi:hypothetical protein